MIERVTVTADSSDDPVEQQLEETLRPKSFEAYVGQKLLKETLALAIEAAASRSETIDHVLLYGPPGLGKTTMAGVIAAEMGVGMQQTSGPVLQKKLDLVGILSNI